MTAITVSNRLRIVSGWAIETSSASWNATVRSALAHLVESTRPFFDVRSRLAVTTSTVHVQSARSLTVILEMGSDLNLGDTHIIVLWAEADHGPGESGTYRGRFAEIVQG